MKKNRIVMIEDDENRDEITGSTSIQDNLIIKKENKKTQYIVSLDTDIKEAYEYRKVFQLLNMANKDDEIIFYLNTPGGYIDTMNQFIYHLSKTKASTKSIIHSACSAGAVIALCCDKIETNLFSYMMIHSMSTGTYGKIIDVQDYSQFAIYQDKKITSTIFQGFLTKQEIFEINKGKELWLNQEEIDRRLKNWKPIKARNII